MKYAFYSLLAGSLLLTACGNNVENDGEALDTANNNSAMADTGMMGAGTDNTAANMNYSSTPLAEAERAFVMKAASGGMMEVTLGNMAQEKGESQRVKDFGAMMVRDHGKANSELTALAQAKGTEVPQELMAEHQKHVEMLRAKNGAAFDRAYMDMMVKDHQKEIAEFEKTNSTATDADLKAFTGRTLTVLKMHLDSAQAINRK